MDGTSKFIITVRQYPLLPGHWFYTLVGEIAQANHTPPAVGIGSHSKRPSGTGGTVFVARELTVTYLDLRLVPPAMDSDLDDILNDSPVAPAAPPAAPASADAPPQPASSPIPSSAEVEKAPDVVKPTTNTQEPIVEAALMSTESAVLVSASDLGEDIKGGKTNDDKSLGAATDKPPPASLSISEKPPASVASASKPKETTAAEAKNGSSVDDDGWGLSSVTAALGGWGFGGSNDEADTAPTTALGSVETDPVEEEDWKHQAEAVEDAAAAAVAFLTGSGPSATAAAENVEEAMGEAANAASAAASSFFSGATEFLSGVGDDTAAASTAAAAAAVPPPDANDPTASALRSFYELNPMNKLASGWIDALERENADADPHRDLRAHLDNHLRDWPRSTYEEWVEEALCALDGWDQGSAVVDDTFYSEDSVHRNIWNETNYQRAEEEGGEAQREFVPARGAGAAGAIAAKAQPASKGAVKTLAGDAGDDADLDGLIGDNDGEEEIVFVENSDLSGKK